MTILRGFVACATAGCLALGAGADEAAQVPAATADGGEVAAAIAEEKDDSLLADLTVGLELEFDTAYVYHGAVLNDRPVASVYPYFDYQLTDDWSFGAAMWILNDLTNRRRREGIRGEWNERDYELHADYALWTSEDEKEEDQWKLNLQFGYYWETYTVHGTYYNDDGSVDYRKRKDYPFTHYSFAKLELANPYVTPFVNGFYDFIEAHSLIVEAGVKKEIGLGDLTGLGALEDVTLELTFTANGGHKRMLNSFYSSETAKTGIASLEGRAALVWQATEQLSLTGFITYTGLVNSRIQNDHKAMGSELNDWYDHDQLVWGGLMAAVEF